MLTDKQRRFVEEYLVNSNGTRAAIRAGYSPKTARAIACENLTKPAIAAEIKRRTTKKKVRALDKKLRVWRAIDRVAFAEAEGIFDDQGGFKDPDEWPREALDAIAEFSVTERFSKPGPGGKRRISRTTRVKLNRSNKIRALIHLDKKYSPELWNGFSPNPPPPAPSNIVFCDRQYDYMGQPLKK